MKKYRCLKCGNAYTHPFCSECGENISESCAFETDETGKNQNTPSEQYHTIKQMEVLSPDMAFVMSKTVLNKSEQKKFKKGYMVSLVIRIVFMVVIVLAAVVMMIAGRGFDKNTLIIIIFAALFLILLFSRIRRFLK